MSKKVLLPLTIICTPIIIVIFLFARNSIVRSESRRETFKELLGTYKLDLTKTKLGDYSKDSNIYKNLSRTFLPDSTFTMNMQVPFMYDSLGRWRAGDISEWCWLFFKKFGYDNKMYSETNPSGSQFTRPFDEKLDTFFLINAATPRDNEKTISDLYFKKVKFC